MTKGTRKKFNLNCNLSKDQPLPTSN